MTTLEAHTLSTWWLPQAREVPLWFLREGRKLAIAAREPNGAGGRTLAGFSDVVRRHALPWFELDTPVALEAAAVDKSWGRELWLSGMEARGVSQARGCGGAVPLPWLLAGTRATRADDGWRAMPLLKYLQPRSDERGDLYHEVHRHKWEVYIVTRVDPQVWPDGSGSMLLGASQSQRARYQDDTGFRAAFCAAAAAYEAACRDLAGTPGQRQFERRQAAADALLEFSASRRLAVGDVVVVPPGMPHGLRRGVEVLEIQSPLFERLVLSFAQPLAGDARWDSAEGAAFMDLEPAPVAAPVVLASGAGASLCRLAQTPGFTVSRLQLQPGAAWALPVERCYHLAVPECGDWRLEGKPWGVAEPRLLLPREGAYRLGNSGTTPARIILVETAGAGAAC